MTDKLHAMPLQNCTAINIHIFNVSNYHQADWFSKIKQSQDPKNVLRDIQLLHVTSFRAWFRAQSFDWSRGIVSVMFSPGVSDEDLTTISTVGIMVGCKHLSNSTEVSLLNEYQRLDSIWKLHVRDDLWLFPQHILVLLSFWKNEVPINEARGVDPRNSENKLNEIALRNITSMNLMKTILNLTLRLRGKKMIFLFQPRLWSWRKTWWTLIFWLAWLPSLIINTFIFQRWW